MCGIVGYVGTQQAAPILLEGLSRLEYRGYDSAGICVAENGVLDVAKCIDTAGRPCRPAVAFSGDLSYNSADAETERRLWSNPS